MASLDSFKCRKKLTVGRKTYHYYSLKAAEKNGLAGISQLLQGLEAVLLLEADMRHAVQFGVGSGQGQRTLAGIDSEHFAGPAQLGRRQTEAAAEAEQRKNGSAR